MTTKNKKSVAARKAATTKARRNQLRATYGENTYLAVRAFLRGEPTLNRSDSAVKANLTRGTYDRFLHVRKVGNKVVREL